MKKNIGTLLGIIPIVTMTAVGIYQDPVFFVPVFILLCASFAAFLHFLKWRHGEF
jgi:hypothetical protein